MDENLQCSTERPQCSECRKRHTPCNYLQPAVRPVAASARRYHGQVQVHAHHHPQHALLRHIFAHLRSQPWHVAQDLLAQLRRGTDERSLLRFLEYGSLRVQLKLVPDTTYQFTAPYLADMMPLFGSADNPYLASRLYKALSNETAHHGTDIQEQTHSAIYHVPYPGARMYDPRMSPDTLRPSKWTSISDDDVFLTRLLEGYFLYEFPLWPCFHKDHFLDDMTAERSDYCSPLLVSAILTAACTPIYLGQTFLSLIKLRCIMNDIAGKALPEDDGDNNLDIEQASRYHLMLVQWFRDLPEPLQPQNAAMPTQLLLHMQFHNLVTMTFQPFLEKEKSLNWPNHSGAFQKYTGFSPAQLYAASKASLQTLLHMFFHRHGFEAYYIFLLQVLVQLGFDSIERLRTPEAQQEHFPAIMKATRATLILCAKGLRDQGHNFFLSELVFRILRDKMNPVDVRLLKDWAHIKDEGEREKSMMEHVYGEYPVNVESITSDPTEQRLNRLLQTMADLKLPNDTAEPTQQDRASRTWRSIVF
ncbi:hypothetical protein J4E90_005003 [Alternaria incomplexa]|uniref:uncharacterized protein n=1 Tax=Alternaria incomplexa TaxID=1187928 RepID=UPI00221EC14A|nr:uncharacterized protein J4E90_005003 [Alternaria incomplexa]KAI4914966.1 hypothetical protein J4E90_005003 [Alternaria incomplexa]